MVRLILMCGLPGSGKTTLARQLAASVPAVRLCPDEWMTELGVDLFDEPFRGRVERAFWSHAQDLLRAGVSVILESGFWLRSDRDEKRLGARALGAAPELHYMDVPFDELVRRLTKRNASGATDTVEITRELLGEYTKYFEAPDDEELRLFDPAT